MTDVTTNAVMSDNVESPLDAVVSWFKSRDGSQKAKPARYHYPRDAIQVKRASPNRHMRLNYESLVDENSTQLLRELLQQLKREGHDVSGAYFEFMAMRELLEQYTITHGKIVEQLQSLETVGLIAKRPV